MDPFRLTALQLTPNSLGDAGLRGMSLPYRLTLLGRPQLGLGDGDLAFGLLGPRGWAVFLWFLVFVFFCSSLFEGLVCCGLGPSIDPRVLFAGSLFGRSSDYSSPGGSTAQGDDEAQQSASSAVKAKFPFIVLFWEVPKRDSEVEGVPSWIDPRVTKVHSVYMRLESLVGMANAICTRGPWEVKVLPCRPTEVVCAWVGERGAPYFYFCENIFSKLRIRLPFSDFEWSVLRVLNVAPTQLHPNSWAFIRAFKLLCEDMGREPSFSVFSGYCCFEGTPSRSTTPVMVVVVAEASPLLTVGPAVTLAPKVVLVSVEGSPRPTVGKVDGSSSKRVAGKGALQDEERPAKQVADGATSPSVIPSQGRLTMAR
ncbi:hypothetical protein CR513_54111, partial [Mucuna pruriens]